MIFHVLFCFSLLAGPASGRATAQSQLHFLSLLDCQLRGLEQQLAAIMGKPVDLVMADAVRNPYVRRDIEALNQLIYEA